MKLKTKRQFDSRGWQVAYQMAGGGIKLKEEFLLKLKNNPRIHRKIRVVILYEIQRQSILKRTSKQESF